jgi:hypothetical protein
MGAPVPRGADRVEQGRTTDRERPGRGPQIDFACEAALDRPHRASKLLRSFLGRHAFEKAQEEDVAKLERKLAELSIQDGPEFERFVLSVPRRGDVGGHGSQTPPPLHFARPSLGRDPRGDTVQPRSQPLGITNLPGLANQHEKRRLKRIVGIVRVAEQRPRYDDLIANAGADQLRGDCGTFEWSSGTLG